MRAWIAVAVLAALAVPGAARAQLLEEERPEPTPFDRGKFSLGVSLGTQSAFDERYFAVGGGVGYFFLPGLEIGVAGTKWFGGGGGPSVASARPSLRYVAVIVPGPIKPFAATFYNHWFIGDGLDDVDSVGGTLGIVWYQRGSPVILSLGATVEQIVSECADDCTDIYPALGISIAL